MGTRAILSRSLFHILELPTDIALVAAGSPRDMHSPYPKTRIPPVRRKSNTTTMDGEAKGCAGLKAVKATYCS